VGWAFQWGLFPRGLASTLLGLAVTRTHHVLFTDLDHGLSAAGRLPLSECAKNTDRGPDVRTKSPWNKFLEQPSEHPTTKRMPLHQHSLNIVPQPASRLFFWRAYSASFAPWNPAERLNLMFANNLDKTRGNHTSSGAWNTTRCRELILAQGKGPEIRGAWLRFTNMSTHIIRTNTTLTSSQANPGPPSRFFAGQVQSVAANAADKC